MSCSVMVHSKKERARDKMVMQLGSWVTSCSQESKGPEAARASAWQCWSHANEYLFVNEDKDRWERWQVNKSLSFPQEETLFLLLLVLKESGCP